MNVAWEMLLCSGLGPLANLSMDYSSIMLLHSFLNYIHHCFFKIMFDYSLY
jgi:hypothetical protein